MTKNTNKPIFVSWTRENGRSSDLAKALDADLFHVYPKGNLLMRYLASAVVSRRLIGSLGREQSAILMLPPAPLAIIARFVRGKAHVYNFYDLHTGFFYDPKWRWASYFSLRLMRGAKAIVTNGNLAELCEEKGVRTHVLHDILHQHKRAASPGPYIVCPVSYSNDEPIERLLTAAANMPQTSWLFTGSAPEDVRSIAPSNVSFSGFLDDEAYDEVISNALIVVALTNRRDTMQRAGYEAIMRGVPVVTSDFEVLKCFFEDSAVYVAEGETDLEQRVELAIERRSAFAARAEQVLEKRILEQRAELAALRQALNGATA
ncbi:hypothetical protein ACIQH9_02350 [Pseudarthrobacter oxydans]|uniref:glycosyltransferase family protein n=1 Tax=Pseudarthrobacter oxydans TaxID=1671 RepID=UPI003810CCD0